MQCAGRRQWSIQSAPDRTLVPDRDIKQLQSFTAERTYLLEAAMKWHSEALNTNSTAVMELSAELYRLVIDHFTGDQATRMQTMTATYKPSL